MIACNVCKEKAEQGATRFGLYSSPHKGVWKVTLAITVEGTQDEAGKLHYCRACLLNAMKGIVEASETAD